MPDVTGQVIVCDVCPYVYHTSYNQHKHINLANLRIKTNQTLL